MDDAIIKLNVGGLRVDTRLSVLTQNGKDNFFSTLVAGRVGCSLDDDGAFFIDRDREAFAWIMRCLRDGEADVPVVLQSLVRREADFYLLGDAVVFSNFDDGTSSMKGVSQGAYWHTFHFHNVGMIVRVGSDIYDSQDLPFDDRYRQQQQVTRDMIIMLKFELGKHKIDRDINGTILFGRRRLEISSDGKTLDHQQPNHSNTPITFLFRKAMLAPRVVFHLLGCDITFDTSSRPNFTATRRDLPNGPGGPHPIRSHTGDVTRTSSGLYQLDLPALFLFNSTLYVQQVLDRRKVAVVQSIGDVACTGGRLPHPYQIESKDYYECPIVALEPLCSWNFRLLFASTGTHILVVGLTFVELEMNSPLPPKFVVLKQRFDPSHTTLGGAKTDVMINLGCNDLQLTDFILQRLCGLWKECTNMNQLEVCVGTLQ
jgi:hypothetical protein